MAPARLTGIRDGRSECDEVGGRPLTDSHARKEVGGLSPTDYHLNTQMATRPWTTDNSGAEGQMNTIPQQPTRWQIRRQVAGLLATGLMMMWCLVGFVPQTAQASDRWQITLEVEQSVTGPMPPDTAFTYRLTAITPDAYPSDTGDGQYSFTIAGTDRVQLAPLSFTAPGVYTYQLRCIPDNAAGYTYDQRRYVIDIYVTEANPPVSVAHLEGDTAKVASLSFTQAFSVPGQPDPVPSSPTSPPTVPPATVPSGIAPPAGEGPTVSAPTGGTVQSSGPAWPVVPVMVPVTLITVAASLIGLL